MGSKLPLLILSFVAGAVVGAVAYKAVSGAELKLNREDLKAGLSALAKTLGENKGSMGRGLGKAAMGMAAAGFAVKGMRGRGRQA